jgi:transcriptional regulator with XRE-family HTH domain
MTNGAGRVRLALPHLRAWREKRVMTQTELAERSGVSLSTIVRVEHGQAAIVSTVRRLAEALKVTRDQLVNEDPEHTKGAGAA